MPQKEKTEEKLRELELSERNYEWRQAAEILAKILENTAGKKNLLNRGHLQERRGRCLYRAAFQARTRNEFEERMHSSVKAYEEAERIYGELENSKDSAKVHARAMALFSRSWLAKDLPARKVLVDECCKLYRDSLKVYERTDDKIAFGKACNDLLSCLEIMFFLSSDWQQRKSVLEEAIIWGEKAVNALSEVNNELELARVYSILGRYYELGSDSAVHDMQQNSKELGQTSFAYAEKALCVSERIGDAFILSISHLSIGYYFGFVKNDFDSSCKQIKKALKLGRKTKDNLIMALSCDELAEAERWRAHLEEVPDKKKRLLIKSIRHAEEAITRAELVSYPFVNSYYHHPMSYIHLARNEPDREKKRILLKMTRETAEKYLPQTRHSSSPEHVAAVLFTLSSALQALAILEGKSRENRLLLEKAATCKEEAIIIFDRISPLHHWSRGILRAYLATIKADLARIETDGQRKIALLRETELIMEDGLALSKKHFETFPHAWSYFNEIGHMQYRYGEILNHLFMLTNEKEILHKAFEIYGEAAQSYEKANMQSRVAEIYWQIAKLQDQCGEHSKAALAFKSAAEIYKLASEKTPQLKDFYSEYESYMKAWAQLEKSRHEHRRENYAQSREHYLNCSRQLERTRKWFYLSSFYFASSLLEHGADLSLLNKPQNAMKAFNEAKETFGDAVRILRKKVEELESSEERDETFKLADIAELRKQYCRGRVLMEEARLSSRRGDKKSSAKGYASAAKIFDGIVPSLEREEARVDLQFAAVLCQAWEKMELAEERGDPVLYRKAAELFTKAGEIGHRKTAGLLAIGNSYFCEALELGMKFMVTSKMSLFSEAKLRMENAASYYQRAGFEKSALWVQATKRLFDAYVYTGKAEAEVEPERRMRFYLVAEKYLESSAKLYGEAGYPDRKNKTLQSLRRVKNERRMASSLSEVLMAPTILSSTAGVSMPDSTEKAAGLNGFESANIRARLWVPDEFVPGEEFQVRLDFVNVGRKPGLLLRVEGLTPQKCEVLKVSSYYVLEDDSLNMKGKRLDPLTVESVTISVKAKRIFGVTLAPRVIFVDELGNFRTTKIEETKILPVVRFESKAAQIIFNYLVNAFIEDYAKRRLSIEKSGWRSLPQMIKGAGVSKWSLYGSGRRLGPGLSELQRKSLIDLKTFHGERGRGGHILRGKIHHEEESVRRYIEEKAPELTL